MSASIHQSNRKSQKDMLALVGLTEPIEEMRFGKQRHPVDGDRSCLAATGYCLMVACALGLSACEVGEDYKPPEVATPPAWVSDQAHTLSVKGEVDQEWWKNFHDPVLSKLIDKVLADNLDLKMAGARIAEARAGVSAAGAALLPSGDVKGVAMREANQMALPDNIDADLLRKPFNLYETGFDASWEVDLFGGKRRAEEEAEAQMQASEASREDIRVSLLAEVARTYVSMRQIQSQISLANDIINTDEKSFQIAQQRFAAGEAPRLDVMQAEARLEQDKTALPALHDQLAQVEYGLDVLMGEEPGAAHKTAGELGPIPALKEKLLLTAPAAVIAQRPDLRVAERGLAAATAQQGVALAKFFPDISLSGFLGVLNSSTTNLISPANGSWIASGTVLWPILSYNSLSANLDSANAQQQEAMARYQKTVIGALSDVERSVTAYTEQEKSLRLTESEVEKSKKVQAVALERYQKGLTTFLEVLEANRMLYASQNRLTQSRAKVSQDAIAIYKSLGGGWAKK